MRFLILIISLLVFSSCLKEELPIPKTNLGGIEPVVVDIKNDYPYQAFFQLSSGEVTGQNTKEDWDLGFENGAEGQHIIINYSRNMFVYPTGKNYLSEVQTPAGYLGPDNQRFDSPYGEYDSLAMREFDDGLVRLIDMGYGINGQHIGWYKVKMVSVDEASYKLQYAPLVSNDSIVLTLEKENGSDHQFKYYSFLKGEEANVAPVDNQWDLVFTQFTQRLYEPLIMPYLVTGTLMNRVGTKGAKIMNKDFDDIDLAYVQSLTLTDTINIIGYEWKSFDFDDEDYTVYTNICYVIQDSKGDFYKLKFLDFYSPTGEKGYNKFIYQKIEV